MGFDCTMHVIDPAMIRDQFVPRLLGISQKRSAFDEQEDAKEMWEKVRAALKEEPPEVAAVCVCQLAMAFCAAELPYHYERGFCLSLWEGYDEPLRAKVPEEFRGKPDAMFAAVTQAYPRLAGHYPAMMNGNWSPGIFVSAEHVSPLLAWVRKRVAEVEKQDRNMFRGLQLVLEAAAARKLAYWEGTEMPVKWTTIRPPRESWRKDLREFELPEQGVQIVGRAGECLFLKAYKTDRRPAESLVADLSRWPPRLVPFEDVQAVARSSEGRWATLAIVGHDKDGNQTEVRVRTSLFDTEYQVLELQGVAKALRVSWVGFSGERVVAEPRVAGPSGPPRVPLVQIGGNLVPAEGARPGEGWDCGQAVRLGADVPGGGKLGRRNGRVTLG